MTPAEVDAEAKRLWDALDVAKPDWDQLGDVTKSVWRERARGESNWPFKYAMGGEVTIVNSIPGTGVIVDNSSNQIVAVITSLDVPKKLTLAEKLAAKGLR